MRVLVCGSRDWSDPLPIRALIAHLPLGTTVVAGGARGADRIAAEEARAKGLWVEEYPVTRVDWHEYGKSAGPLRNERMIKSGVQIVHAFSDHLTTSNGTLDTVLRARRDGIEIAIHAHEGHEHETAMLFRHLDGLLRQRFLK